MKRDTFPRATVVMMVLLALVPTLPADGPPWPDERNVKDYWEAFFHGPVLQDHDIWVFEADMNGDGVPDIFISDEGGYRYSHSRGWTGCISEPGGRYSVLSSGFVLGLDQEGVIVSGLQGVQVPALVVPMQGNRKGPDGKWHDVMRYRVTYLDLSLPGLAPGKWLEDLYPEKSDAELAELYEKKKAEGVRPKPYQVKLEELAEQHHIMVYKDVDATYNGLTDPGYRWIGPGLPKEGVPIPWGKGVSLPPVAAKVLRDALASSATLSSALSTTSTMISARPTTLTKALAATPTPSRRAPLPATPTPTPAASTPRGWKRYPLQAFLACVAVLLALGGVFVYSRRRR